MSNYFLYVGNAYPHKNLNRVIEATKLVQTELRIACSRSVFTQKLKSNDFVKLLGFVEDAKLTSLYRGSVAAVLPSLSEGFGLPGIEAMKAGTLVLASDIPVFREVYQDNAFYFDPLDVQSIADTLQKALEMSDEEKAFRIKKAQEFVARYSFSRMARETLALYQDLSI